MSQHQSHAGVHMRPPWQLVCHANRDLTRCPAKVLDSLPCIFGAPQQQGVAASGRQQGQLVKSHDLAAGLHVGGPAGLQLHGAP